MFQRQSCAISSPAKSPAADTGTALRAISCRGVKDGLRRHQARRVLEPPASLAANLERTMTLDVGLILAAIAALLVL